MGESRCKTQVTKDADTCYFTHADQASICFSRSVLALMAKNATSHHLDDAPCMGHGVCDAVCHAEILLDWWLIVCSPSFRSDYYMIINRRRVCSSTSVFYADEFMMMEWISVRVSRRYEWARSAPQRVIGRLLYYPNQIDANQYNQRSQAYFRTSLFAGRCIVTMISIYRRASSSEIGRLIHSPTHPIMLLPEKRVCGHPTLITSAIPTRRLATNS